MVCSLNRSTFDINIYFIRVTLFDDPDDDMFDGTLGEDDEDAPRAYLNFRINKVN